MTGFSLLFSILSNIVNKIIIIIIIIVIIIMMIIIIIIIMIIIIIITIIIIIIIIIIIMNFIAPHDSIRQFRLLKSNKFSLSHKKSFFLYYRQNLINITITIISIHASLKGNYKSILKKLPRQVFIKSINKIRENIRKSV